MDARRNVDVAVIGTGPAGQRAAIQAAKLGATVAMIEKAEQLGGTVVNYGTIPSKTLREAILYLTGFRQRGLYGAEYRLKERVTIEDLSLRTIHVTKSVLEVMEAQLTRNGVEVLRGTAQFLTPHELMVTRSDDSVVVSAKAIILAPGSVPAHSPNVPVDGHYVIDADSFWQERQEIPQRLIVVGAGVIGIEYASMLGLLGIEVTLLDSREHILEFLDAEMLSALMSEMAEHNVSFALQEELDHVSVENGIVVARTTAGRSFEAEVLLYTAGRRGNTQGLGLERIGVDVDERGRIEVDDQFRTRLPHIFAVGDVIGFPALAATSMEQGRQAARHALEATEATTPGPLPIGIYSIPELSMIGQTEEGLKREGVPYVVGLASYTETARGQILASQRGYLKLLIQAETRELLGVHIVGESATELIHIGQLAMNLGGRLDHLVDNVFNYPTLAECYKIAALDAFNKLGAEEAIPTT